MTHHCHARGCTKPVKPELLMCFAHWNRVPRMIQRAVWKHYRPGQCDDKRPSEAWHIAADAAIGAVALKEGQPITKAERAALESAAQRDDSVAQLLLAVRTQFRSETP